MIRLSRSVVVSSFQAQATVAVGQRRPELLAVARLAADLGRPIDGGDVLRELLGDLPAVLGRRVIERCVALGLLERSGGDGPAALTASGRIALEHSEVLIPQEDTWCFFLIEDPLVPGPLVHVQRLEPASVKEEREEAKARRPARPAEAPEPLRACMRRSPFASIRHGHLFQLTQLAKEGERGPSGELALELTWEDLPSLRLTGRLPPSASHEGQDIDAELPLPEALARWSYEALWRALVTRATHIPEGELEQWAGLAHRLVAPARFASLPAAARRSFRRDLTVPAMRLLGLGDFQPTTLREVDVVPATERDAEEWLHWMQWEDVVDYVAPETLEAARREQLARFPHHRPRALNDRELLAKARAARDERAWFVIAPADLGLWEVA